MSKYTTPTNWQRRLGVAVLGLITIAWANEALAVGKAHSILIQRGLQLQGLVTRDDAFNLRAFQKANYSTVLWLWDANAAAPVPEPGVPWGRWVQDETKMPMPGDEPHFRDLVSLQLGDEWDLNDAKVRDRAVAWFDAIRDKWPNTILYMNNWGGQVNDAAFGDFIARAKPDMLSFDAYPFQSDPATHVANGPAHGSPTNWYSELRRYRIYAENGGVPFAVYRQTFHSVEGTTREYRSPSPSEMNLNTFAALTFGATALLDFTYNTGASTVAPSGSLRPDYKRQSVINRRAKNLGKSLVHLTGKDNPLDGKLDGGAATKDVLFIRGKTGPNPGDLTPLPGGFVPAAASPMFSDWTSDRNDPFIRGWEVTNLGTKNDKRRGDVIVSWFKPRESSKDAAGSNRGEIYLMITNGLTGPEGSAADYRQRIQINFLPNVGAALERLNSDTCQVELVELREVNGRRQLDITLDGGIGQLFKFKTGRPFVGAVPPLSFDYNRSELRAAQD